MLTNIRKMEFRSSLSIFLKSILPDSRKAKTTGLFKARGERGPKRDNEFIKVLDFDTMQDKKEGKGEGNNGPYVSSRGINSI